MSARRLYLILCVLGAIVPYVELGPFLLEHGFDFGRLAREAFANRVSSSFALDVIVSAVVVFGLVGIEGRRSRVPHPWAPLVATLLVGVSLGLPLFLYLREGALARVRNSVDSPPVRP